MKEVIEFDSRVTQKDLVGFKFYHKYHSGSGIMELLLALVLIVLCVISAGRVRASYTAMVGVFGVFFLVFPSVELRLRAKRQMEKVSMFKETVSYKITEEKITISLGDVTENLSWDNIYKIKFDGNCFDIYITSINANIIPVRDMKGDAMDFVEMAEKKLKPFQVKVNKNKLRKKCDYGDRNI